MTSYFLFVQSNQNLRNKCWMFWAFFSACFPHSNLSDGSPLTVCRSRHKAEVHHRTVAGEEWIPAGNHPENQHHNKHTRLISSLIQLSTLMYVCVCMIYCTRRVLSGLILKSKSNCVFVCSYLQWYDALKAVARLPTGIPKEWRKRVRNLKQVL